MDYRIRLDMQRSLVGVGVAAVLALGASSALAQPNPFDDYDQGVSAVPEEEPEALPPEEPPAEEAAAPEAETAAPYSVEQFLWSAGLGTQLAYTGATNEVLSGDDESNRTLYLTIAPRVGFFPVENFEVGLGLGLLSQLAARESGDSTAQNNFFFEASAHYHIPVGSSFAIIPGLGLGGYFGSSSRTLVLADDSEIDEKTSSRGFLLKGYLGVGYEPHPNWRLRSGIVVGGLFGSETVESQEATLSSTAVHVGLPVELSYLFH